MSAQNRIQNFNSNQSRSTKTFRSSDSRRPGSGNRSQQRGNSSNRMANDEGNNRDGTNQTYHRLNNNKPFAVNQNATPNCFVENDASKDITGNVRSKQNNNDKWIAYCEMWGDYVYKGLPHCFRPQNPSNIDGKNNYNGSSTVGVQPTRHWESTNTTYSSVVGTNCQPPVTKQNISYSPNSANLVSNKQVPALLPNPSPSVPPEKVNSVAVGKEGASSAVSGSSQVTANTSHSYNNNYRYDGNNYRRRGNYTGKQYGNQTGYRNNGKGGYSFNRNPGRLGEHLQAQSFPLQIPMQYQSYPYECHVPYADCQACCYNSLMQPIPPFGIPMSYPPVQAPFLFAPVAMNPPMDPSMGAASSLPTTPRSTPSDASANSDMATPGNMKVAQNSEKLCSENTEKDVFVGNEASQDIGISSVVPNSVGVPRGVPMSSASNGEHLPVQYFPQQVFIPANAPEMQLQQGYFVDPQYLNYVNDVGCFVPPPQQFYLYSPNYAMNTDPSQRSEH